MYQAFAELYDILMNDVDYEGWADYYTRLLSIYGIQNGRICECACGTGAMTIPLYYRGFQMTGVDISREMLWQAAQKSRKRGIAIPFVQQDMKSLNLHRPVDAVLATCDGVNYLMTEEELSGFFNCARRAIRPEGALIFDVSTPYKLKNILCAGLMGEDREEITYLWQNTWHERQKYIDLDLVFFIRKEDGSYRRIEEHQKQKAWDEKTLKEALWQAGFRTVSVYGDYTMNAPKETSQRWHIAAVRTTE